MPEISVRLFSQFLLQGVWCVILALIIWYTYRVYQKPYLKLWSFSWCAYAIYLFAAGALLYVIFNYPLQHPVWTSLTMVSISASYIQTTLLIAGTWELIKERRFSRSKLAIIIAIACAMAVVSSLLYSQDPQAGAQRFFIRISIRAIITGIGFIGVGIWIINAASDMESLGKKLLTIAFIIFGLEQINYFLAGLLPLVGVTYNLTPYTIHLGMIDLLLQALIGMGMVIWLLETERSRLKKANAELDSFFYSTSHDLRAPISSILGLTYLAKREVKEEASLEFFERIEGRVLKLDEVINDILNYSRSSKKDLNLKKIDFNVLLEKVAGSIDFTKGDSKIRLDYEANENNILFGDEDRLTTVLSSLLSNAVKYHDPTKEDLFIKVSFNRMGKKITVIVADNGSGIAAEDHQKVFGMFYRASTESEGSGLGLFIAKEALKKINGSIQLISTPGVGSTFSVEFAEPNGSII